MGLFFMYKIKIIILFCLISSCETIKNVSKVNRKSDVKEHSESVTQKRSYDFSLTDTNDYSLVIEPLDSKVDMTIMDEEGKVFKARNARYTRKKTKRVVQSNKIDTTDNGTKISKEHILLEKLKKRDKETRFRVQIAIVIALSVIVMFLIGLFMVFRKFKTISEKH